MKEIIQAWRSRKAVMAVEIQERSIRLMELRKHRGGIRRVSVLEESWKPRTDSRHLETEYLKNVATKFNLSRYELVVHLPQRDFLRRFVKLPSSFDGNFHGWIDDNIASFLPPGLAKDQVVFGFQGFRNSDAPGLLLTLARSEVITKWTRVFRDLDICVIALSTTALPLLSGFAFSHRNYYEENWAFLHHDGDCISLLLSRKADLMHYEEFFLDQRESSSENRDQQTVAQIDSRPWQQVVADKLEEYQRNYTLHQVIFSGMSLPDKSGFDDFLVGNLTGDRNGDLPPERLPAKEALLFGLGVEGIYPRFESKSLLAPEYENEVKNKLNKIDSAHFAGQAIIVLICVGLGLLTANFFTKQKLAFWEQETAKLQSQILQIENLKNYGSKLSSELAFGRVMMDRRTDMAGTLFTLSKLMPKDVWLRNVRYGRNEANNLGEPAEEIAPLILEGLARTELGPTMLLAELERIADFSRVQLEVLQSIPANVVLKKTRLHREPLIKFKISASL